MVLLEDFFKKVVELVVIVCKWILFIFVDFYGEMISEK